mgnify:CR=1 FL=1
MTKKKTKNKKSPEIKERSIVSKEEWKEYTKTVWHIANVSHEVHPAVFPEEIPKRLIKLFSFVEETVLDPFAGIGTTGKVAAELERSSILVDQSAEYCKIMNESYAENEDIQIINGDSRVACNTLEDDSIGLVITSPPYWDKANYGGGKKDIGDVANYLSFFEEIRPVFEECYRVLMPGRKICLVTANVNQQTNHGLLSFPLSTDFTVLLRDIGFVLNSHVIWSKDKTGGKWGSANQQRPIFGSYPYPPNFKFKNVHEYIIIFEKPKEEPSKGPKVKNYEQLMRINQEEE